MMKTSREKLSAAIHRAEQEAKRRFERVREILADPHGDNLAALDAMRDARNYAEAAMQLRDELKAKRWTLSENVSRHMEREAQQAVERQIETAAPVYETPRFKSDLAKAKAIAMQRFGKGVTA